MCDHEITQSQIADKPVATRGRAKQTNTNHQEDKQSIATSLPIEMIAKLEWTQSSTQQNIEQLQNPTMGVAINNKSTALERTTTKATGDLNAFFWYQIFTLDSAVVVAQKC